MDVAAATSQALMSMLNAVAFLKVSSILRTDAVSQPLMSALNALACLNM